MSDSCHYFTLMLFRKYMTSTLKKISYWKKKHRPKKNLKLDLTHTYTIPGGHSYLGSHNAEAHAIVLLQGYRDNLWLLPHWLKWEMDRKERMWLKMKPLWCVFSSLWEVQPSSGVLPLTHYRENFGVKRGRDEKREGRNEGGIKENGENHRGTCGHWNEVKNDDAHTHTHTRLSRAG